MSISLESLQHYDQLWPKQNQLCTDSSGAVKSCAFCLINDSDGEDGACSECRESLKDIDA